MLPSTREVQGLDVRSEASRDVYQGKMESVMDGLGTTRQFGDGLFMLTSIRRHEGMRREVWTHIPDGMGPQDLGRKFHAAIMMEWQEPSEREDLTIN